jgi:hypothetical protein
MEDKKHFTGTIMKGFDPNKIINKEVCVDGEKGCVIKEYDPQTGEIKIEVQKTVYDTILEKMGKTHQIGVSSRRCINEICSEHKETPTVESAKAIVDQLSEEEREKLFSSYKKSHDCKSHKCHCQNDE